MFSGDGLPVGWIIGIIVIYLCYAPLPTIFYKYFLQKRQYPRATGGKKILYLTFDDGPQRRYTPQLLQLLKEQGALATFFVATDQLHSNEDLLAEIVGGGHSIGLHCHHHGNPLFWSPFRSRNDIRQGLMTLRKKGIKATIYRPPHGTVNLALLYEMRKQGMRMILWDVLVGDWEEKQTGEQTLLKLVKLVQKGSVICLHDGTDEQRTDSTAPRNTITALRTFLPFMKAQGWQFNTNIQ